MTEYLIYHGDKWYIAHPGAIEDDTEKCLSCDGTGAGKIGVICSFCDGTTRVRSTERVIRLAWFERDASMICFDYSEPEVKRLPD